MLSSVVLPELASGDVTRRIGECTAAVSCAQANKTHSATTVAASLLRITCRCTRRFRLRSSASVSTSSGHGSTSQWPNKGGGPDCALCSARRALTSSSNAPRRIPKPFAALERRCSYSRRPSRARLSISLCSSASALAFCIRLVGCRHWRLPVRRLTDEFVEGLARAAGNQPVSDVAFRRQTRQHQNSDTLSNTGQCSADFLDVFVAGIVVVGDQNDIGTHEKGVKFGTPFARPTAVGSCGDAEFAETIDTLLALNDEYRAPASDGRSHFGQRVRE